MTGYYPELPPELGITDPEILTELPRIWREVCTEILDQDFKTRSHLNRKTYEVGCRGPLCTKANRDFADRLRTSDHLLRKHRIRKFDVPLLFFMVEAQKLFSIEKKLVS